MNLNNEIINNPNPGLNREVLLEFMERRLNFNVPNDLRILLIKYKDKIEFERKTFMCTVSDSFSSEMTLEFIDSIEGIDEGMIYLEDEEILKENKILIFGETLGAAVIGIGCNKDNYNSVFVFDNDFALIKISDSFNDFIKNLY